MSENDEATEGTESAPDPAVEAPAEPDPVTDPAEIAPEATESAPEEAEAAEVSSESDEPVVSPEEERKRAIRRNMSSNDRCRRRGLEPAAQDDEEADESE